MAACRSREQQIADQQQALESLRATARAVGDAWLSGSVSATYARTAIEAAQRLLDQRRAALAASPDLLADPKAAALSGAEEQLARSLAALWKAVDQGDTATAKQQVAP
jgi:hypothetical protein